ncbi:CGNR zinc finger domain-containing protein [Saccharothrix deserti]|uniref:CGNR zinc finger domain-containing protein n=1 Tax=Saccharothrix deserti TaxID=2593674 RepID=UPI00192E6CE4|nr:CGNR zinc finger domain-containing protein [Saccharothrix deserti]
MSDDELAAALRARGWPPRPLTDQPLAVDLLDTRWLTGTTPYDLLDHDDLTSAWLVDRSLDTGAPVDVVRRHLLDARSALAAVVAGDLEPSTLDTLLDHGRLRLRLTVDGPAEEEDVPDPAWRAAWACLRDYLALESTTPDRVRKCANPDCTLHFHDTSRTGKRQWCSMSVCGNRFKARRHHSRTHA